MLQNSSNPRDNLFCLGHLMMETKRMKKKRKINLTNFLYHISNKPRKKCMACSKEQKFITVSPTKYFKKKNEIWNIKFPGFSICVIQWKIRRDWTASLYFPFISRPFKKHHSIIFQSLFHFTFPITVIFLFDIVSLFFYFSWF